MFSYSNQVTNIWAKFDKNTIVDVLKIAAILNSKDNQTTIIVDGHPVFVNKPHDKVMDIINKALKEAQENNKA
jgi:hypothetical protein